jgi:hypothetical protein
VIVGRFPVKDIPPDDPTNPERISDFKLKYHDRSWFLQPMEDIVFQHSQEENLRLYGINAVSRFPRMEDVYCDLLPTAADTGLLFHLGDKGMRVWKGKSQKRTDPEAALPIQWTELKGEAFAPEFLEPFQVFGDERTWFIMTESGKLWVSRRPGKGQRLFYLYWIEAESPIRALLTDTASGQTFAFTEPVKGATEGRAVYFALADKPDPRPYQRKPVNRGNLSPALKAVLEYAQVLVADKRIQMPRSPNK